MHGAILASAHNHHSQKKRRQLSQRWRSFKKLHQFSIKKPSSPMYSGAAAPTEQIEFVSRCSLNLIVAFFFAANGTRLRVVRGVLFLLIPEPCYAR